MLPGDQGDLCLLWASTVALGTIQMVLGLFCPILWVAVTLWYLPPDCKHQRQASPHMFYILVPRSTCHTGVLNKYFGYRKSHCVPRKCQTMKAKYTYQG